MQNTTTHQSATGAQQHWNQLPMYASAHQRPTAANPRAYTAADYNSPAEPRRDDATSQLYGADQASSYNNYSSGYNGLNNVGSYNYASTGYSSAGSPSTARRTSGQKPSTSTPPASAPITGAANPSPASRYYPSAQQGTTETTQYQPSSAPPQVGHHQNHPYQSSYYNNYYDQSQMAQQYQGHSYQSSTPSSQPSASQHQYPSYNQRTQQWQQQPQTGYPSMQSVPQYGWQQAQQQQQWNTPQYGYPSATPQSAAQPQHSQPQGHHNTIPPLSASVVPPAQIQTTGTPGDEQTGKKPKTPSSGKRPAESGTDEEAAPAKPKKSKKAAAAAAVEEKPVPKPPSKSHLNPPRQAQSAWQLFFTDELNKAKAASVQGSSPGGTPHHAKLNVAQIAKDAGLAYANLSDEQKVYYAAKVQESKDEYARELAIWHTTLTPEDIRLENAFRAQQRKDGKSRKGNLKDPNAPKKPLSAYFLFLKGIREDDALRARVWGVESETTKQSVLAAERWRNLSDVDKKPFLAQAEKDKQEYEVSRKLYEDEAAARARGEDIPLRIYAPISIDPAPRLVLRDVEKKEADGATAATTAPIASSTPAETSPHGSQDSFHGFIDGRLTDIDLGGFQDVTAKGTGEQGDWGELTQLMGPADGVNTGPDVGSILPTPVSADSTYQQGYDGVKQENTIQPGFEEAAKAGQPMSFDIGSAAESVNDVANPGNAQSTSASSNSGSSLVSSNSGSHGDAAAQGDGSTDVTAAPATTSSLESAAPAADGV